MNELNRSEWLYDSDNPNELHLIKIDRHVVSVDTHFQKLDIMETRDYGKVLVLDDKIQSAELDGFIYHETLVTPSLIIHPEPSNILVIGGGEGSTLREVLKCNDVENIVMIDIDETMIETARKYLTSFHDNSFEDDRVQLIFQDGRRYIEETSEIFDVIIIDITDPIEQGPSYLLYTEEFYKAVYKKLHTNGIITVQAGPAKLPHVTCLPSIYKSLEMVFEKVRAYTSYISSYNCLWAFVMASKAFDPCTFSSHTIDALIRDKGFHDLNYYDGETHTHIFSLPKYLRNIISTEGRIIRDKEPLYIV